MLRFDNGILQNDSNIDNAKVDSDYDTEKNVTPDKRGFLFTCLKYKLFQVHHAECLIISLTIIID
jgi:hypothetical protein